MKQPTPIISSPEAGILKNRLSKFRSHLASERNSVGLQLARIDEDISRLGFTPKTAPVFQDPNMVELFEGSEAREQYEREWDEYAEQNIALRQLEQQKKQLLQKKQQYDEAVELLSKLMSAKSTYDWLNSATRTDVDGYQEDDDESGNSQESIQKVIDEYTSALKKCISNPLISSLILMFTKQDSLSRLEDERYRN